MSKLYFKIGGYLKRLTVIVMLLLCVFMFVEPSTLSALGGTYFDDDGSTAADCDVGNRGYATSGYTTPACTSDITHKVRLTVGQSSAVPYSYVTLQAGFFSVARPTGATLTISGADLCPTSGANVESRDMLNNGHFDSVPDDLPGGANVTRFRIGTQTAIGEYRRTASNCSPPKVINLGAADFQPLVSGGFTVPGVWTVTFIAEHCEKWMGGLVTGCTPASPTPSRCNGSTTNGWCDGIKNGFQVSTSAGTASAVRIATKAGGGGLCTEDDGKCTTVQTATGEHGDYGRYITYIAKFGSDCTVPAAGKPANVSFYDLDYPGGDGVIKLTIRDTTTNTWLWPDGIWRATRPTYAQARQAPYADAAPSRWGFTALQNHNYELYIINVSPGLVMQFGTPFDGIFYSITCPVASVSPSPRIVNAAGVTPAYFEEGDSYTSQGNLVNSSTAGGSVNASWQTWYDDTDMLANGIGETGIYSHGNNVVAVPGSGTVTALGAGTVSADNTRPSGVPGTISGGHRFICSRVYGVTTADGMTNVSSSESTSCIPIQRRPYFQVTHGDTNASAALASTGCTTNTTSTISAFNKGNVPTFTGSGTGVAAFAAGVITEFTSGSKPNGLTFANTTGAGDVTYGGGFRNTYCIPDYWGNAPAVDNNNVNSATGTLVTNGDVFISESSINTGGLTFGIDNIQLRWIIAKNIYISSSVGYLEGNYIAKEKIYTCATGLRAVEPMSSMVSNCGTALTVNGTFIAGGGVKLQRTFGSLNNSPAETFVYSPEIWIQAILPNSSVPGSAKGSVGKYDSITLLPPVL